jgi:hypothetical protein
MRQLVLVALGALAGPDGLQPIVGASLGGAGLRMASLGIRHGELKQQLRTANVELSNLRTRLRASRFGAAGPWNPGT